MSRFTSKIDQILSEAGNVKQQAQTGLQAAIAAAKQAEKDGKTDPTKKPSPEQQGLLRNLRKATKDAAAKLSKAVMSSNKPNGKVVEAEGDDFVPRQGPETGGEFEPKSKDDLAQEPSEEPTPDPMTTEGETFYVNLARKALFVDLDNTSLTDAEREIVTQDVEPANAKEVAKVLRKIVVDAGLSENFDSKIDTVWEDLQLSDLRSKLSLELKKTIE